MKKISIVVPIFNEEDIIEELLNRICEICKSINYSIELLVVNDGSHDNTLNILKSKISLIPFLKIINLSRNFGHQSAYMAGLSIADGDAVIMMDGDLQDPPEFILELIKKWNENNDIVLAARKSRNETFIRKILFTCFHKFFRFISDHPMPVNSGMFCLIDKVVATELNKMPERNRFIPGLRDWLGFKSTVAWYDRDKRFKGKPKQSFVKLLNMACDAIFSFSYKPLRLILLFGFFISSISIIYAITLFILRIIKIDYVKGFTTPTVAILFLGGLILFSLGILGEYLGRIYDEVKQRPIFIISEIISYK